MKRADRSSVLKLGLVQTSCSPNPTENLKKTLQHIGEAAMKGAQIICTQELFRSQYFCQTEDHEHFQLAETIPGPSTAALQKVASQHHAVIIASLFEKRAPGI